MTCSEGSIDLRGYVAWVSNLEVYPGSIEPTTSESLNPMSWPNNNFKLTLMVALFSSADVTFGGGGTPGGLPIFPLFFLVIIVQSQGGRGERVFGPARDPLWNRPYGPSSLNNMAGLVCEKET